jgi:hypothetical protein
MHADALEIPIGPAKLSPGSFGFATPGGAMPLARFKLASCVSILNCPSCRNGMRTPRTENANELLTSKGPLR